MFQRRNRIVAIALGYPLVLFIGMTLLVRVLTDGGSSPDSHHSGSLNLSGVIAVLFILVAIVLLLRQRRGVLPTVLVALWLCIWTAVAVGTNGASAETVREGVREASIVALAVIVYNARGRVTVSAATRLVQLVGFAPAIIALYQTATNTGRDVAGELRADGTFAHPNSAAMFFAIAACTSLWRYLDGGQRRSDLLLTALYAASLIATFSIDGLISLVAMLTALGALRPGSFRAKVGPWAIAAAVLVVFFATPVGAHRISSESSTSLAAAERGDATSSLTWRLHKWETLLPEWERSPVIGRGIGTTVTPESIPGNDYVGEPPHNEYVRYLVETGVVGLAVLLWGLAVLIRRLVRERRLLVAPSATLGLVIVVGCLVNSLADNTLLNSPTGYAAALILAAVLSSASSLATVQSNPV